MCESHYDSRMILKYADDSVVVSLLRDGESSHGPVINDFVKWCKDSYLQLNMSKTKDMIIDFQNVVKLDAFSFLTANQIYLQV